MFIKSLSITNWKCFPGEVHLDFSTVEIFSFKNGAGKTSILEAIHYGIWGKTDYKMSSYQNHGGQTQVDITFDIGGVEYKIERAFPNTKAILFKDGQKFREGIKEVFDYINSIMDYNVAKRLWFKGDVSEAPILDFNFFKKEVLSEKLKEPITLQQHYTHQANLLSREMKGIAFESTREVEEIQKDIDELSSKLKTHSNSVSNSEYVRACHVRDANESFSEVKKFFDDNHKKPLPSQDIYKWKNINAATLTQQIQAEKEKVTDDVLSHINSAALKSIEQYHDEHGKCMICENEWTPERTEHIKSLLAKGVRDIKLESSLKEKLEYKESISQEDVTRSEEYYKWQREAESMPNWEDVINNYNKEAEDMWDTLDALNREKDMAVRSQEAAERIKKLSKEIEDCKAKRDFVKGYLDAATEALTTSLFTEASNMLSTLNSDYEAISVSPEDNTIQVVVRGKELALNQISRGEKTLVALSLIYTIRDIFCPGIPLIFDESFASLSKDNNNQVIDIVKDSYEQLFIISHNSDWVDYPNYGPDVNVRTEWA